MIQKEVEDLIEKEKRKGEFIYPYYEKYCFSNIPSTILKFFDIKTERPALPLEIYENNLKKENFSKIVLFLVDGLGYNQWIKHSKEIEIFNIFNKKGLVTPLTSVFPSTTAATLTTISSGLTPQEHGLPEWVTYFKEIDTIINTLPFSPLGEEGRDLLSEMRVDPRILFKGETIYHELKKAGVKSFCANNESHAYSAYSKQIHKGSKTIPFFNPFDLIAKLKKVLEKEKERSYFYVYIDDVDYSAHKDGPNSERFLKELARLSYFFKEFLKRIDKKVAKDTIVLIAADHGQINVYPEKTLYLNMYQELANSFQRSEKGRRILPTGSPRDVFLHIEQDRLEEVYDFLSKKLDGKAKIIMSEDAISLNLFGIGKPTSEFKDRIGNLLILPYRNNTIWYEHIKGKKFDSLGHHGGLSKNEMLVPFALANLSDLF